MTTVFPTFGLRAANQDELCEPDCRGVVFDLASIRHQTECLVTDDDLHAYVDAVLEAGQRAAVEARLARDPEARLMALAYRILNVDLHRLFDRDLPPISASLEALTRELERRINAPPFRDLWARLWRAAGIRRGPIEL